MNKFDKLIFELNILSNVQIGAKLSTEGEYMTIEYIYPLQFVQRWWRGDNRTKMIYRLRSLIETAILIGKEMVECGITDENKLIKIEQLSSALHDARTGLINIDKTYNDPNVTANIAPLLSEINTFLLCVKKMTHIKVICV